MDKFDDRVVRIFDEMEQEYDEITDLWYSWLFSRLHYFIATDLAALWTQPPKQVLDAGCGTGFQSFLYAALGCEVAGIDISPKLVAQAAAKSRRLQNLEDLHLFPANFPFVGRYHEKIRTALKRRFSVPQPVLPKFSVASVETLPFPDNFFDHVNCCGSVLSFCADYRRALREMQRVLRPGGTFIFEVEGKFSPDTFWTIVDSSLGGFLGYDSSLAEAFSPFRGCLRQHIHIDYPFGEISDPVYMPIRLFSKKGFRDDLNEAGYRPFAWRSIHAATNLIPSTLLDSSTPSRRLTSVFRLLARAEELSPFALSGCSIVVLGTKTASG